jgi:hypothetical protein
LLSHFGWSLRKKKSWIYGTSVQFPSFLQNIPNWRMAFYLMLPPSGHFSHLPEDTVVRPGCSKTWITFVKINILVSRQGGILPGSLKLDSLPKKESKGTLINLTEVFSFYLGVPRWGETLCGRGCQLPPMANAMGKTFMYIWLQPHHQSDPDQFYCLFVLLCLLPCDPGTWFSSTTEGL